MYIFNYRNEKGIRGGCTKEVGPYCNSPLAKQCDPFQQNLVSYLPLTQLNEFLQISAAAAPLEEHSLMAISIIAVDILVILYHPLNCIVINGRGLLLLLLLLMLYRCGIYRRVCRRQFVLTTQFLLHVRYPCRRDNSPLTHCISEPRGRDLAPSIRCHSPVRLAENKIR